MNAPLPTRRVAPGISSGISAYLVWGMVPIYFRQLSHVPAIAVVSHRVLWSLLFVALLLTATRQWPASVRAIRSRRAMLVLTASTIAIAVNWLTFIYAVQVGRTLDASIGYFIAPLVNVLLGVLVLGERLRRGQSVALLLAMAGVGVSTWARGGFPWIALTLAGSFGVYGLLRKIAPVGPLIGLFVETLLLAPLAAVVVAMPATVYAASFSHDSRTMLLLAAAGIITAVPLLLFADAARKLRLATIGFLQYIGPTVQFLVATFVFHELVTRATLASFLLIWSAVAVYCSDAVAASRQTPSVPSS